MTVEWTGWPDVDCPDCGADAGCTCHWWCARYEEDADGFTTEDIDGDT